MYSGNGVSKAQLSVGVTPTLKLQLRLLARKQHRSLASMVRVLLEEAVELEETLRPTSPDKKEYEIILTSKQAARLIKKGHDLQVWEPQYSQMSLL